VSRSRRKWVYGVWGNVFPGFFLPDVEGNIRPKFRILQEHGFYRSANRLLGESDSCGAHSPG